jgi:hypothetical protein
MDNFDIVSPRWCSLSYKNVELLLKHRRGALISASTFFGFILRGFKMKELFRDTVTGHAIRLLTKGRVLQYEEERDSSLWRRYVDKEKSGRMAHHGHTGEAKEQDEEKQDDKDGRQPNNGDNPRDSDDTRVDSPENTRRNEVSGVIVVDPEKGRDATIVTWFSDDDPEVDSSVLRSLQSLELTKGNRIQ